MPECKSEVVNYLCCNSVQSTSSSGLTFPIFLSVPSLEAEWLNMGALTDFHYASRFLRPSALAHK